MPILAINKLTGKLEGTPEIVMRGFAGARTTMALSKKPAARCGEPWNNRPRKKWPITA